MNMRVKVTISKLKEINLSDSDSAKITRNYIESRFNIPEGAYIKDENLMRVWEEWGGPHSWEEREVVRVASEEDKAAVVLLNSMRLD